MWPGFIERSYGSCTDDLPGDPKNNPGDLCWRSDNATMSLSGMGGRLIRNDGPGDVWRPEKDNGARVERLFNAANGDDNGEHWRITTIDGTQYFFGSRPEANSTWTVPVFGDDPGEPCNNGPFDTSSCVQAYRWNLDKVLDPHGNVVLQQYQTETNYYGRNKSKSGAQYVRDGWLKQIDYGVKDGSPAPSLARVVFTEADRCVPGSDCTFTKPKNLPDVPLDEKCDGGTCPDKWSPTFWTSKRLSKVTTQVRIGDGYSDVDSWELRHEFPDPGDGEKASLWLAGVTHTGHAGIPIRLPEVTFEGVRKANRVSGQGDPYATLYRFRMNAIVSESGGVTSIKYADPQCAIGGSLPDRDHPENNTLRCFPARWAAPLSPERTDFFHKYVVESVTSLDRLGSSVGDVTRYDYLDGAAWHYDKSEITKDDKKTWNEYRGFSNVKVTKGTGNDGPQQVTQYTFYRGMHGDKLPTGTRPVMIKDSEDVERYDEDWLAGMTRESITYNGTAVVSKTINDPGWSAPTATRGPYTARRVFIEATDTYVPLAAGGRRVTRTETDYNDDGLPIEVNDLGDIGTAADDLCTRTRYARNTDTWMLSYPSRVDTVSVNCGTTAQFPHHAVEDVRTSYDGQDRDVAPTLGNVTKLERMENHPSTGTEYTVVATSKHDIYGRVTEATDALGHVSKTKYTPEVGLLTKIESINAVGHTTTTEFDVRRGQAQKVTDPNGAITESTFDALGRVTETWLGNRFRSAGDWGNHQFSYAISRDQVTAVTTKSLNPSGNYTTVNEIYDGLFRPRQVQTPSPGGGRLLTDTRYDSAGRAYKSTSPYFNNQSVDTNLWSATDANVPALTLTEFDGAGRPVKQTFKGVARQWETTTQYGGDRVFVTPPQGATPTTAIGDARGRTVELRQHKSATEFDSTRYEHTPAGQLAKVTDPGGSIWKYTYDLRGRKIREEDPDKGTTTTSYDLVGRIATSTDARNTTLAYAYDAIGRRTAIHEGSLTGPKRAEWTYDTATFGIGYPANATRWINNSAYSQKITDYNGLGQAVRIVTSIPAVETGLAGDYATESDYFADGSPVSNTLPKIGNLQKEQVTYSYNDYGLPSITYGALIGTGTIEYATGTEYTKYGEAERVQLGVTPKRSWVSLYYEDDTRHLKGSIVDAETAAPMISETNYSRDPAGNVTSITDTRRGDLMVDRQCFSHDHLQRLTEAWTPSGDCTTRKPLAGPAPYWQSFTYDNVGNRLTETQHGTNSDTVRTYTYPPTSHKLQSVSTQGSLATPDEFSYDNSGNTTRRKLASADQTLDWDAEGHLSKVSEAGQDTEFVYDANGNRLIRRDPSSITLYLPGQELKVNKSTKAAEPTRYYTHGGTTIAVRTNTGLTWLASDHQGTAQISINAQDLQVTRRRQTPFGAPRGPATPFPGEKGFVGGAIDASIGLTTLGARQYDAATGRFLSVDPIMDLADPQQMHGYTYANNSPVTVSDPSGLKPDSCEVEGRSCRTGELLHPPNPNPTPAEVRYTSPNRDVVAIHDPVTKQNYVNRVRMPANMNFDFAVRKLAELHANKKDRMWLPQAWDDDGLADDDAVVTMLQHICGLDRCGEGVGKELFDMHVALLPPGGGKDGPAVSIVGGAGGGRGGAGKPRGARQVPAGKGLGPFGKAVEIPTNVEWSIATRCSFVPGTMVLMADGTQKPIEDLRYGDMVLATDPETGEAGPRAVLEPLSSDGIKILIQITIDADGPVGNRTDIVTATDNHPFWSPELRKWITASELRVGSLLQTSAGTRVQVTATRLWAAYQRVHNLSVDDLNTYYVVTGGTSILVHNAPCRTFGNHSPNGRLDVPDTQGVYIIKMDDGNVYVGSATESNTIHKRVHRAFTDNTHAVKTRGYTPANVQQLDWIEMPGASAKEIHARESDLVKYYGGIGGGTLLNKVNPPR